MNILALVISLISLFIALYKKIASKKDLEKLDELNKRRNDVMQRLNTKFYTDCYPNCTYARNTKLWPDVWKQICVFCGKIKE